jgi:hypothetical protein
METQIAMSGKPYQSCLIPHENEIIALRRHRPPMSYAKIAELLRGKYQLHVCRETVFKFLRVRSRSHRIFRYGRNVGTEKPTPAAPSQKSTNQGTGPSPRPVFEFTYSERYNLKRLPREEAAAIRKKLEEEGH